MLPERKGSPRLGPVSRRPELKLSEARIVDAAVTIADAEGLDALTMRRLATEFGSSAMAFYNHVAGKEALLELIAERTLSALPQLDHGQPWQAELSRFFTTWHEQLVAHPATAQIMAQQSLAVPSVINHGEDALALLLESGFDDALAVETLVALGNYTLGASLYELSRQQSLHRIRDVTIDADKTPLIYRMRGHIAEAAGESQFNFGLDQLIGGIAARAEALVASQGTAEAG